MDGSKAEALAAWCASEKRDFLRFDYFGHGRSEGNFIDGTVSLWREEVFSIISELTNGPQIIVGSSFGGWLSLMAAGCHEGQPTPKTGANDNLWAVGKFRNNREYLFPP